MDKMETTNSPQDQYIPDPEPTLQQLQEELRRARAEIRNLLDMTTPIIPKPGQIPQISGIDIYGESIELNGSLGGDHIIFIDFNKRFDLVERMKRAHSTGKESRSEEHTSE